jgi:hypothetical protein
MDHAVNRAPVSHEMSTTNRGSILPAERGSMIGKHDSEGVPGMPVGLEARNAFMLPADCSDDAGGDPTAHLGRA